MTGKSLFHTGVALIIAGNWLWGLYQYSPYFLQREYGIQRASSQVIVAGERELNATVLALETGKHPDMAIAVPRSNTEYAVYLRDTGGLYPIVVPEPTLTRSRFLNSRPVLVEQMVAISREGQQSWRRELWVVTDPQESGSQRQRRQQTIAVLPKEVAALIYDLAVHK